jgi:hypothetical protein
MRNITQVDSPPLQDFHAQTLLGKIFHTLLGYLNHSFLRCQWLVVRPRGADQAGQGDRGLSAIEQEVGSEAGRLLQGVERPETREAGCRPRLALRMVLILKWDDSIGAFPKGWYAIE